MSNFLWIEDDKNDDKNKVFIEVITLKIMSNLSTHISAPSQPPANPASVTWEKAPRIYPKSFQPVIPLSEGEVVFDAAEKRAVQVVKQGILARGKDYLGRLFAPLTKTLGIIGTVGEVFARANDVSLAVAAVYTGGEWLYNNIRTVIVYRDQLHPLTSIAPFTPIYGPSISPLTSLQKAIRETRSQAVIIKASADDSDPTQKQPLVTLLDEPKQPDQCRSSANTYSEAEAHFRNRLKTHFDILGKQDFNGYIINHALGGIRMIEVRVLTPRNAIKEMREGREVVIMTNHQYSHTLYYSIGEVIVPGKVTYLLHDNQNDSRVIDRITFSECLSDMEDGTEITFNPSTGKTQTKVSPQPGSDSPAIPSGKIKN